MFGVHKCSQKVDGRTVETKFSLKVSYGKRNVRKPFGKRETIKANVDNWNCETWGWQMLDGLGTLFRIFCIGIALSHGRYNG